MLLFLLLPSQASTAFVAAGRGVHLAQHMRTRHQVPPAARPAQPDLRMVAAPLPAPLLSLRGGLSVPTGLPALPTTPSGVFNLLFYALAAACGALALAVRERAGDASTAAREEMPPNMRRLQRQFLAVFWLYKMADWLQGPYFYEVYSSKIFGGTPATEQMVALLFLVGFGSTAIFGTFIGGAVDLLGRRAGSLCFALLYSISALSTRAVQLPMLLAGRLAGGLGTSLLFSAPEAWFVSEHAKLGIDGKWLGQTFGLAYFVDSLVAITAGRLAGFAAAKRGPSAPFELSVLFLAAGAAVAASSWRENFGGSKAAGPTTVAVAATADEVAEKSEEGAGAADADVSEATAMGDGEGGGQIVGEAIAALRSDAKIQLVGAVQALFEGAMYIFVLQWPPAMKRALHGAVGGIPFGLVFSCFMVCCMIGSTAFSALVRNKVPIEQGMQYMLLAAAVAMSTATAACARGAVVPLVAAFFAFEACVGFYFPAIGSLRSAYLPDAYRGVIMNLYGVPLNLIVVAVFLSIGKLGVQGALTCSASALGLAAFAQLTLRVLVSKETAETD